MQQESHEQYAINIPSSLIGRITRYCDAVGMSLDEFIGRAALAYFEMAAWNSREHPLKVARDAHGLSISELAAALLAYRQGSETLPIKEMTKGAASLARSISRWEKGENIPDPASAAILAAVLEFPSAEEVRQLCVLWQALHEVPVAPGAESPGMASEGAGKD
jgi:transcriptional regulator with XRE-family HTH domain